MEKDTANNSFYIASTALAFVLAIFSVIFFDENIYPFNLILVLLYLVLLFSPFGQKLLKESTNYIRVLTVAILAIIASVLVGLVIPTNIAQYYDKKGALAPDWSYSFFIFFFGGSIIVGFILAYMIFKKYYKKQGKKNEE